MDHGILDVRTEVNAMRLHTGVSGHRKSESALKVNSGGEIPCRIGESNLRWRRVGPTLYQLSYIPTAEEKGVSKACQSWCDEIKKITAAHASCWIRRELRKEQAEVAKDTI